MSFTGILLDFAALDDRGGIVVGEITDITIGHKLTPSNNAAIKYTKRVFRNPNPDAVSTR